MAARRRLSPAAAAGPRPIQPQAGRGDDVNRDVDQPDARRLADALEPCADQMQRILGGIEQRRPAPRRPEPAQARDAGGDRDQHVEGEKTLAALRFAADDTDGFLGPEVLDEPAVLWGTDGELARAPDRQAGHRGRPARARGRSAGAGAKRSKKSCSSNWVTSRSAPARSNSCACAMSVRWLPPA